MLSLSLESRAQTVGADGRRYVGEWGAGLRHKKHGQHLAANWKHVSSICVGKMPNIADTIVPSCLNVLRPSMEDM